VLLLVAVCPTALAFAWVWSLPRLILAEMSAITGAQVTATSASFNPITGRLLLADLRIEGLPGFSDPALLNVRRIEAQVSLPSLLARVAHIRSLDIDIASCTVVSNEQDRINWGVFGSSLAKAVHTRRFMPSLTPAALVQSRDVRVESLTFTLDRVRVVDGPRTRFANLRPNLKERLGPLESAEDLWHEVAYLTLAGIAREALLTPDNRSLFILKGVARELGTSPRRPDAAIDNLLRSVWPD
jgi:hypothetical protein